MVEIIVESEGDSQVIEALLEDLRPNWSFKVRVAGGREAGRPLARRLLISKGKSVALLFDTGTTDSQYILKQEIALESYFRILAPGAKLLLLSFSPSIEAEASERMTLLSGNPPIPHQKDLDSDDLAQLRTHPKFERLRQFVKQPLIEEIPSSEEAYDVAPQEWVRLPIEETTHLLPSPASSTSSVALHNLPLGSLHERFVGRDDLLRQVASELKPATSVVLTGLDGIGKTRLAVEYAWQRINLFRFVFFVPAGSPAEVASGLARLANRDLLAIESAFELPESQVAAEVLRWLRKSGGWLLILDGVNDQEAQEAAYQLLPLGAGEVILTSMRRDWRPEFREVAVEPLAVEAARAYLLRMTDGRRQTLPNDGDLARQLAEKLGALPLALEIAAEFIGDRRLGLDAFLEDWPDRISLEGNAETNPMPFRPTMAIWRKSTGALPPDAQVILTISAFMAPEPIPIGLFERGAKLLEACRELLPGTSGEAEPPIDVPSSLTELERSSFIHCEPETLTIHPVLQDWMLSRIHLMSRGAWLQKAIEILLTFPPFDPDNVHTWRCWALLEPHAVRVGQLAEQLGVLRPASTLFSILGSWFQAQGQFSRAERYLRRTLAIDEVLLGKNQPEVALDLNNLAELLKATGRTTEAGNLLQKALEISRTAYPYDARMQANILNNLAPLHLESDQLQEAEVLLTEALKIEEIKSGERSPAVARQLNNLAVLYQNQGRIQEAKRCLEKALEIDLNQLGDPHPNAARTLQNLAKLHQDIGSFDETEKLLLEALRIDTIHFDPDHPRIALRLANLANFWGSRGRLMDASIFLRRRLEIHRTTLSSNHPAIAIDLGVLADVLLDLEDFSEAISLLNEAVAIEEASFGQNDSRVASRLNELAQAQKSARDLDAAERSLRRAVQIDASNNPSDDPALVPRLNSLADLLRVKKNYKEAEELLFRGLEIRRAAFGDEDRQTKKSENSLQALRREMRAAGPAA